MIVLHQADDEVVAVGPLLAPDHTDASPSYYVPAVGDTTTLVIKPNEYVDDAAGTTYAGQFSEDAATAGQWWTVFSVPRGDLPTLVKRFARVRVIDAAGNQQTVLGEDVIVDPGRKAQRARATTAPVLNLETAALEASAISVEPFGTVAADTVQTALEEIASEAGGGSGSGLPSTILTKTANYTALDGEYIQADAAAAGFAVTLPSNPAVGALVAVKKIDATANVVTIDPAGAGTVDGDANATTSTQWAGAIFEHLGSDVWAIAASMTTTGPQGATGPQGPQGEAGPQGDTGAAGAISVIQDEGTPLTVRSVVNFVGAGVTAADDVGNGRTNITVSAGSTGGPAGGVLSGTYPDPGFAVDMATQAELDASHGSRWLPATDGANIGVGSPNVTSINRNPGYGLDAASTELLAFLTLLPASWATFDVDLYWSVASGSGNVAWRLDLGFRGVGDTLALPTTGTIRTFTAPAATVLAVSAFETAVAATAGKLAAINVSRIGADAADTLGVDAVFLGILLRKAT